MKILVVHNSLLDRSLSSALQRGLEMAHEVRTVVAADQVNPRSLESIVRGTFTEGGPQLIILKPESGERFSFDDLREVKVPKAIFVETISPRLSAREFIALVQAGDISLVFSSYPQLLDEYRGTEIESQIFFLPPCFDPEQFRNWAQEKIYDIGIFFDSATSARSHSEQAILNFLHAQNGLRVFDGTSLADASPSERSRAMNRCRICFTGSGVEKRPRATYFEILASHSLLLADKPFASEMLTLRERDNFVPVTPEEASDLIDRYLRDSVKREALAAAGGEMALQEHSAAVRARELEQAYLMAASEQDFSTDLSVTSSRSTMATTTPIPSTIRLHLGCGHDYKIGYINIDADPNVKTDLCLPLQAIGEHFGGGTVDEILMIHSIAYLTLAEARDFFALSRRLLKPTGSLIIETPNIEKAIEKILTSNGNFFEYLEGVRAFHAFGVDQFERGEKYQPYAFSWSSTHLLAELQEAGFQSVYLAAPETHSDWRDMRVVGIRGELELREKGVATAPLVTTSFVDEVRGGALVVLDSRAGQGASSRVQALTDYLKTQGVRVRIFDLGRDGGVEKLVSEAASADAIYLHQINSLELVERLKQARSGKIVFDISEPLWKPAHRMAGWIELEKLLAAADLVWCENQQLAEYAARFQRTVVIPSTRSELAHASL